MNHTYLSHTQLKDSTFLCASLIDNRGGQIDQHNLLLIRPSSAWGVVFAELQLIFYIKKSFLREIC